MFSPADLSEATKTESFREDLAEVFRNQAEHRLARPVSFDDQTVYRLQKFVSAVLVSAPGWENDGVHPLVSLAAEIAEALVVTDHPAFDVRKMKFRCALLYELADQPAMAAAQGDLGAELSPLDDFFRRKGPFRTLGGQMDGYPSPSPDTPLPASWAIAQDAQDLAAFQQGDEGRELLPDAGPLEEAVQHFNLDLNLTDIRAFEEVVRRRAERGTHSALPKHLVGEARQLGLPLELWRHQIELIEEGLLSAGRTWGVAAPTGSGKTFLATLIALSALSDAPGKKVLYIVPSNALVHQVSRDLANAFDPLNLVVNAVTPQLVALDDDEDEQVAEADILVLTPEKADLLLRIGAGFLADVVLVIVDEAHHIESGTRGVLLEMYLTRLKTHFADQARYVLLSAVTPNIGELAAWVSPSAQSRLFRDRATRMRVGVYRVRRGDVGNQGWIDYIDGSRICTVKEPAETGQAAGLVQLAAQLATAGPVLVVAKGQNTAESLAERLKKRIESEPEADLLGDEEMQGDVMQRLDARLEREMYPDVALRGLLKLRIAYHHAGLPPRVREAVEQAITDNHIRYVIATTTLGEGVNFPFSSVIVQALAIRNPPEFGKAASYRLVTPRTFWNIAGRAGRPGFDHEGQVVLYEPSLGLEHVNAVLDPYVNPSIEDIAPVSSALGNELADIAGKINSGAMSADDFSSVELDEGMGRGIQGVVNLLRVGIAHARAAEMNQDPGDLFDKTFAGETLDAERQEFARSFFEDQARVVDEYLARPSAPPLRLVAELGLSLDTLSRLQGYVEKLKDWQIEQMSKIMFGGRINFDALRFIVSPVLKRMAELEGRKLGALYTETVVDWCQGKPFAAIPLVGKQKKLEELIGVVYSRIGYLLPWGLYAFDRFIEREADRRGLQYENEIRSLAYLVDVGVPDVAALVLSTQGFERTDAARLSRAYYRDKEARETTDVMRWLVAQPDRDLLHIVRGVDSRRVDFDFRNLLAELRRLT